MRVYSCVVSLVRSMAGRCTGRTPTLLYKCKRSVAILGKKIEIERELQNGHSQRTIAEKYGVARGWRYLEIRKARGLHFIKQDPAVRAKALRHAWAKIRCSCQWLETQGTATEHLILVKKWRDSAAHKTDITSYFAFSQYACAYNI